MKASKEERFEKALRKLKECSFNELLDIDVSGCWLEENRIALLAEGIVKSGACLLFLNLGRNSIGDDGIKQIADILQENRYLLELDISRFYLFVCFSQSISKGNLMKTVGLSYISKALMINTSLVSLDLSYNQFDNFAIAALSEALKANTTLMKVNLECCHICTDGCIELGECLKANKGLLSLNLANNQFANGSWSIASSLETNSTLTELNLEGNPMALSTVLNFSNALKTNKALIALNLKNCFTHQRGSEILFESVMANSTILNLTCLEFENSSKMRHKFRINKFQLIRPLLFILHYLSNTKEESNYTPFLLLQGFPQIVQYILLMSLPPIIHKEKAELP